GYMGAPLLGGVFLVLGQTRRGARSVLLALALMLGVTALFFVRNDFGLTAVGIGAGALLVAAALAPEPLAIFLVNFVAAQACINAVLDIRVLFRANLVVNGVNVGGSDAHNMAAVTFGTAFTWATIWLGWSLVCFFVALRLVYVRQRGELPGFTEAAPAALAAAEPRSR
ncbi:MAG TPA: M50 family metallopeptidase, partial [Kofleriaceae bacterium]|nr:M50 family metallopeptidase [Kofleriaceae bacterium]